MINPFTIKSLNKYIYEGKQVIVTSFKMKNFYTDEFWPNVTFYYIKNNAMSYILENASLLEFIIKAKKYND